MDARVKAASAVLIVVAATVPAAAGVPKDVLFNGQARFTVPAGAEAVSDPVALRVPKDREQIIAGLAQIAAQARARGLPVVGATIMPFEGWRTWTPQREAVRVAVNDWIRRSYAAVADFDAVTRDPADPARIAPAYDSGDHLHPNDAGDLAMANVVPLNGL